MEENSIDDEHVNEAELETNSAVDDELDSEEQSSETDDKGTAWIENVEKLNIIVRRSSSSSQKPANFWRQILMRYRIEICVFLAVFFSVCTTFLQASGMIKAKLQLRRQAPPQRFFSTSSPVVDLYQGNGAAVHELLVNGEYVFVMYYAPWCIRCAEARFHFDRLSRTSAGDVRFFAVNCWDPGGRCRYLYKMYTYPVFILYSTATFKEIYYNGVISADYMYRFLKNSVHPFVRLDEINDVDQFLLSTDVSTALAYHNFAHNDDRTGYDTFHWTSMKALEQDPLRDQIRFALITNPRVAQYFNLTIGMVRFYNWSSSFDNFSTYPSEQPYKSELLIKWMFSLSTNKVQWYSPSSDGSKSELLQEIISKPTIILFTPRQPLLSHDPNYLSFVTAAMKYFDCDDSPYVDRTISMMRRFYMNSVRSYERWKEICGEPRQLSTSECCRDIVIARTHDTYRNICDICLPQNNQQQKIDTISMTDSTTAVTVQTVCSKFVPDSKTMDFFSGSVISASRSCDELSQYLKTNKIVEYCCDSQPKIRVDVPMSSLTAFEDVRNSDDLPFYCSMSSGYSGSMYCKNVLHRKTLGECNKHRLTKILNYTNVFHLNDDESYDERRRSFNGDSAEVEREFRGLSCRTNRTLTFLAVDSNHYRHFVQKLGLIRRYSSIGRNFSGLIIVDPKVLIELTESVYRTPSSFKLSSKNFNEFILNFTNTRLRRHLKTEEDSTLNQFVKNNDSEKWTNCSDKTYRVCIDKITSRNFRYEVLERKKDVVLLFTTAWCGLCQQIFHVFHSLAYYFRFVSHNKLSFAQIDADKNDLPWEFTMNSYPSILFLPAKNVNESVAFPQSLPITLPNLISFVLANCRWRTRLQTAFSLCSKRCIVANTRKMVDQMNRYQRSLDRLRVMAKDKAYLWDWVEDDEHFGPFIPSYLSGIWKDIAETQVKIRTLRSLLRFLSTSRISIDDLYLKRNFLNYDDLMSLLQNNNALLR